MAVIRVDSFAGIAPVIDARKLPSDAAQSAEDCIFEAGDLRPIRSRRNVTLIGMSVNTKRLYQWRERWLAWDDAVTRVVPSPVAMDENERIYWSRGPGKKPRYAHRDQLISAMNMSSLGTDLGINRPGESQTPVIVVSALPDMEVNAESMSQTSPVRVATAVDHPFKNGQRVVVTLVRADGAAADVEDVPPPGVGMGEMNGREYVTRTIKNAGTGIENLREIELIGADGANFSMYEPVKWVAQIKRVLTDSDMDSRSYVYTYVSTFGEESQPSDPSEVVDVVKGQPVQVKVQPSAQALAAGYTIRLYRSVSGPGGTNFFLVKDNIDPSASIVTDDLDEVALGEMLPSSTWAPPPEGLDGLVTMPNGFLAGFVGNTLYFSEPYQPHAWPFQFTRTTQDKIIGLAVYGQTLVVATAGRPYIATGSDPGSVSLSQLDVYAPCMGSGTIADIGSGVVYASQDGLVHISNAGARILTQQHYSKRQWQELMSTPPKCTAWHDGRLFMALDYKTVVFQPAGERMNISTLSDSFAAAAVSTMPTDIGGGAKAPRDSMIVYGGGTGYGLSAFNYGANREATWKGKVITLPQPVSLSCAQVFAADYPVYLFVHAARIRSRPHRPDSLVVPDDDPDGQVIEVRGPEVFRLASGFLAREWRIDVVASHSVQSVVLSTSMDEIRQV